MKKVLFALPILALALFLTYCAKENVKPATAATPAQTQTETATDRGDGGTEGECTITITASDTVRVCGLSTNNVNCTDCYNVHRHGLEVGKDFSYTLVPTYPDIPFSITNITADTIVVKVETGGHCGQWTLAPGQCEQYGWATTCLLLSAHEAMECH